MGFTRNISQDRLLLGSLLQRLGVPLPVLSPLIAHADAVAIAADRLGLIAPSDRDSVLARHTADSLLFALARTPRPGERWVDVGSGAGFPGMVLACCYPATRFALIESNSRKAGFLELQAGNLGLNNTEILARRAEEVDGGFDVAVARAYAEPARALLDLRLLVRVGGEVVVAAGRHEEVPAPAHRIQLEEIDAVDSPGVLFMMSREA